MKERAGTIQQDGLQSLDFDSINHVGDVTWHLLWKKYRTWTILLVIVVILFALSFFVVKSLHVPFIGLVLFLVYYGYIHTKAKHWFMQQFALANNLEYKQKLSMGEVKGRLFGIGHSRVLSDVVSVKYQDHFLRLFHYQYTAGHGKYRRIYHFTVTEIFFEQVQFPHILLQSRTMAKYGSSDKNIKTIELEEEFEKFYRLHAAQGYEIEIFQIFTPEALRFLKEKGMHFSIEFAENRLYVYDDKTIVNKKQLFEMYEVTRQIFDSIGPLLNRLHDDFATLHPYYGKK